MKIIEKGEFTIEDVLESIRSVPDIRVNTNVGAVGNRFKIPLASAEIDQGYLIISEGELSPSSSQQIWFSVELKQITNIVRRRVGSLTLELRGGGYVTITTYRV